MFAYMFLFIFSIDSSVILVDLQNFEWKAYRGLNLVRSGQASGGRKYCPDVKRKCKTPAGIYQILAKRGKYYKSPLYPIGCGLPPLKKCAAMPYYIKFKHTGEGIHGSNDNWNKPQHISHGCVHVPTEDAKWLNESFITSETLIVVWEY